MQEDTIHHVFVAASDINNHGRFNEPEGRYAWSAFGPNREKIASGWDAFGPQPSGDVTKLLLPAILEALKSLPYGACVIVYSDLRYLISHLNTSATDRVASDYRKSNGEPFADADALRTLDRVVIERGLRIAGEWVDTKKGSALEWQVSELRRVKSEAEEARRNIGKAPGEWNT